MRFFVFLGIIGALAYGQSHLVLYSSGLALVEETRVFPLAQHGTLELSGFPSAILWETLRIEGLEVLALRPLSPRPWGLTELLGKEVTVQTQDGTFRGVLREILAEGLVVETPEGVVVVREYRWLRGPAYIPTPQTQALLHYRADSPGEKTLRFRYLTSGLGWGISYDAEFDRGALRVLGKAFIQNDTGVDFCGAKVTLVAGEIRAPPRPPAVRALAAGPEASPLEAFEHYRYDLPGTWDLPQGRIALLLVGAELPAAKVYRLVGEGVEVRVRFNTEETILPGGEGRVYADGLFVGSDQIPHLAKGRSGELRLGTGFDLRGARTLVQKERLGENLFRNTWRVTVTSAKNEPVVVEVIESLPGYWRIVSASFPYEILDAQRIKFAVPVPPRGESTLEYTVEWRY